ncbi:Rho GTPase-activating protein gacZ [Pseudolycoriella hygida]|uniref:Rho GTPase-activating protein gacZ n=1 Tax=Pseudolycoriella hygida TaxID=35572 RepID=A0A9Q0S7P5_9DIPT|nr:Rho GTPase-activating protein gacZ [Pseudolycoriella hygida]
MSALVPYCPICETKNKLLRCQGCMVVFYCCREHQVVDRKRHKRLCNAINRTRTRLENEERRLREKTFPENVFEKSFGFFWKIFITRDYMRARNTYVETLLQVNSYEAVKTSLYHLIEMLNLCRGDDLGLRFLIPALFIRLDKDQECYDFIKWHITTGSKANYNYFDMNQPFLDVKDADVFEPVQRFIRRYSSIEYAVALMLIKMKLLADIKFLHNCNILSYGDHRLPPEIIDHIRKEGAGRIAIKRKDILRSTDQEKLIVKLEMQLQKLFQYVNKSNKYVWPGFLNPKGYLEAITPIIDSWGSEEHAIQIVQYYYQAFVETTGSNKMIREMLKPVKF